MKILELSKLRRCLCIDFFRLWSRFIMITFRLEFKLSDATFFQLPLIFQWMRGYHGGWSKCISCKWHKQLFANSWRQVLMMLSCITMCPGTQGLALFSWINDWLLCQIKQLYLIWLALWEFFILKMQKLSQTIH